jgi:hypothetical protein
MLNTQRLAIQASPYRVFHRSTDRREAMLIHDLAVLYGVPNVRFQLVDGQYTLYCTGECVAVIEAILLYVLCGDRRAQC